MIPSAADPADILQAAVACHHAGQLTDARKLYERLLRKNPRDPNALNLLGVLLASTGEATRGIQLIRRALTVLPDFPDALSNLGKALLDSNQPEAARVSCERALRLTPDDPETLNTLGNVLLALGRPAEALPCYQRATAVRPDYNEALMNEGLALLALGHLPEAWQRYEHRWRLARMGHVPGGPAPGHHGLTGHDPAHHGQGSAAPRWTGTQPLAGRTILLHAEQGLGDTLQFCRYALLVAARRALVVLAVQPPLVRLMLSLGPLEGTPGSIQVMTQGEPLPAVDFQCPLMSLPGAFGTTVDDIPAPVPYLHPEPAQVEAWRDRLASYHGPRIGLVWAGNPRRGDPEANAVDQRRSMKLTALAGLEGVFVSLQKGDPAREARRPPAGMRLVDWTSDLHDFADTAALTAALDLVIGVDTSVIHLAGAVGTPVWVLNRYDRCWRWLRGRADTPWYPGMRLFTQSEPGNWDGVLSDVRVALADFRTAHG